MDKEFIRQLMRESGRTTPSAYVEFARVAANRGRDHRKAVEFLEAALEEFQENPEIQGELGHLHALISEYTRGKESQTHIREADRYFREALKGKPTAWDILHNYVRYLTRSEQYRAAENVCAYILRTAEAELPTNFIINLGQIYLELGRHNYAFACYEAAYDRESRDPGEAIIKGYNLSQRLAKANRLPVTTWKQVKDNLVNLDRDKPFRPDQPSFEGS